nr:hypothetical protein [Tanacetum cinerariifolium]
MPEHQSDIFVLFIVTMEILLEPTSNKLLAYLTFRLSWFTFAFIDLTSLLTTSLLLGCLAASESVLGHKPRLLVWIVMHVKVIILLAEHWENLSRVNIFLKAL